MRVHCLSASYLKKPTAVAGGVVGVHILPSYPAHPPSSRRAIHIGLVIDTSGSMEGERLTCVKRTLTVLLERLSNGDKISLVSFATDATSILDCVVLSDETRAAAIAEVAQLHAYGGTNMEAGITMLGQAAAAAAPLPLLPDAIVVLTDGHINHGLDTAAGLYSLLNSYLAGVPVYTLGYGVNHNADLLRNIASRSSGTYTFIDNEIVLPAAIGDLLGSLQNEVGKRATLIYPTTWSCEEPDRQPTGRFTIGSLVAEKPNWIMLSVPPAAAAAAATNGIDSMMELQYFMNGHEYRDLIPIRDGLPLLEMEEQMLRCTTAKTLNAVSAAIRNHDITRAAALLDAALLAIANSPAAAGSLAIRMKAQLDEMREMVEAEATGLGSNAGGVNSPALLHTAALAANYSSQRGVTHGGRRARGAPVSLFSSPGVAHESTAMSAQYSQQMGDPDSP